MTNVHEIARIGDKIEKLTQKYGGADDVALNGEAYPLDRAGWPGRRNSWDCDAVQIDNHTVRFGTVQWDFEDELDDAGDYDWDFSEDDFHSDEEFDLEDPEELAEVLEKLGL